MKTKIVEIRDCGTCITAIAIKTEGQSSKEFQFFKRGGWGPNSIILIKTNGETVANYDPFAWRANGTRTMFEAHKYLEEHFDVLPDNTLIDVEYILGESHTPKQSEIWGLNGNE